MTIQRMEHVGIVVDDLTAATEFFAELGFELQGTMAVEGRWVDRIIGLEGVRNDVAMMQTPDGHGRLELIEFHSPSYEGDNRREPANAPGIRHIAFVVEDIDAVVARLRAPRRGARRRARELQEQLPALLRPRPGGDHRRAGRADRLTGPDRQQSRFPRGIARWD
jgi:catechol 2,3-dioxygenase-like lactoylglutathione lyase family enzyme